MGKFLEDLLRSRVEVKDWLDSAIAEPPLAAAAIAPSMMIDPVDKPSLPAIFEAMLDGIRASKLYNVYWLETGPETEREPDPVHDAPYNPYLYPREPDLTAEPEPDPPWAVKPTQSRQGPPPMDMTNTIFRLRKLAKSPFEL